MGTDSRPADELTIHELEALLARKKREARSAQLMRLQKSGRIVTLEPQHIDEAFAELPPHLPPRAKSGERAPGARTGTINRAANRGLLLFEIAAALGFVYILVSGFQSLRRINRDTLAGLAEPPPAPTALIQAVVLPSGHSPPTSPGGARFNEEEIPEHLRPFAQSYASIPIPTPGFQQARSIFIPALWDRAAPVIQGDGWEQLKKGVAQHVGSANPGENGNVVLSAHNDIYGELFRDLDRLRPGDEIQINTVNGEYLYRVTGTQIVEPTEVSVMAPTAKPTVTLISCYPYLVDNLRIVVSAELSQG